MILGEGGFYAPPDITRQIEQKISPTDTFVPKEGPVNGYNCAYGTCPFPGEHCGVHGVDTPDELLGPCVWRAAMMGDTAAIDICIKYYMEENGMTPEQIEEQCQNWARACVSQFGEVVVAKLPTGSQERKETPLYRGLVAYFPRALGAVAALSYVGNKKHNGDAPLHWAKGKSTDHKDCIARHLVESGTIDPEDGIAHDVKLAWRALASLEIALEAATLGIGYDELIEHYREEEMK